MLPSLSYQDGLLIFARATATWIANEVVVRPTRVVARPQVNMAPSAGSCYSHACPAALSIVRNGSGNLSGRE